MPHRSGSTCRNKRAIELNSHKSKANLDTDTGTGELVDWRLPKRELSNQLAKRFQTIECDGGGERRTMRVNNTGRADAMKSNNEIEEARRKCFRLVVSGSCVVSVDELRARTQSFFFLFVRNAFLLPFQLWIEMTMDESDETHTHDAGERRKSLDIASEKRKKYT